MRRLPLLLAALAAAVCAGELTMEMTIDRTDVFLDSWAGLDVVLLEGGMVPFEEGMPALPGLPLSLVLPPGASVTGCEVTPLETASLGSGLDMAPVRYRTVGGPPSLPVGASAAAVGGIFPSEHCVGLRTGSKTGFSLAAACYVPFTWDRLSGELTLVTSAEVVISYSGEGEAGAPVLTPTQVSKAMEGLRGVVRNPEMLEAWAPLTGGSSDWASWIVVADAGMEDALQPLVDHRSTTHGSAELVTVQSITGSYPGRDTQERIRNFLKDAYENHGLVYALIVGDYGETTRLSSLQVGENVMDNVTDHYYADLDGSWDLDGDGLFGERSDGIDYFSDIYVGRFSTDIPSRVETMVRKTVDYETSAPAGQWRETAILIGAGLWPESSYWGSFVCDSIESRLPEGWLARKLYETESGHPTNQIHLMNLGASYVTPQGHGWSGGVAWYYQPDTDIISNSNYTGLTNEDMLCVFHSMACMAGELTNVGCIAERLMMAPWGGAVAVMFNSHYGWGTPPSTGPSEWLEIHFADQMFQHDRYEVGVAQGLAKDAIRSLPVPLIDWVMQCNNYLGDPALLFASGQTGVETGEGGPPTARALGVPAPNPAVTAATCTVSWTLPASATGEVALFDMTGRRVAVVAEGDIGGERTEPLDLRSGSGDTLPPGVYVVVLRSGGRLEAERLVVSG